METCTICPHKCKIDRSNRVGRCKAGEEAEIGGVSLHKFEEPCISGQNGSGTVFFSKCNMKCVFCQNYEISNLGKRKKNRYRKTSRNFFRATKIRCRKYKLSFSNNICTQNNRSNTYS